jgi:hypothetical protein
MANATWCGQCYLDFQPRLRVRAPMPPAPPRPDAPEVPPEPEFRVDLTRPAVGLQGPDDPAPAAWPCPVCEFHNRIDLDACQMCGTPFSRLFESRSTRAYVEPMVAAVSSLFFPGVGHMRCGKVMEGVSRAVLFAWALIMGVGLTMAHPPSGAGPLGPLAGLFFMGATGMYVFSAIDAFRLAAGDRQVLSPKVLLYGSAGLVVLSVAALFVLVFKASGKVPH